MLSPRGALGIFVYVNVISWVLLLGIRMIAFFGYSNAQVFDVNFYLKGLLLNFFILFVFFYFQARNRHLEEENFTDVLGNVFLLGLVSVSTSLLLQLIVTFLETGAVEVWEGQVINILYHINIAIVILFLTQVFFVWKKLIFFQQSDSVRKLWKVFEYLLLISLLFNFFEFDLSHPSFTIALGGLLIMGFALSVNLGWVAYLSAREKWQGILLLLLISLFSYYFFFTVINHSDHRYFTTDLMHSVYVLALFVFVIFYGIFSLLVILFNLPTTSVFEKKIEEVLSFQRLTESLQMGEAEEHVYEVLLDNAMRSVQADAAWLEIKDEFGKSLALVNHNISLEETQEIKALSRKNRLGKVLSDTFAQEKEPKEQTRFTLKLQALEFESMLRAPLNINGKSLGELTLLKYSARGFDEEKQELVQAFTRQASLAIQNYRLLRKTIEAERFKEEIKIAQRVQESLLPSHLEVDERVEIEGFSESAYEVGGDYYDIFYQKKNPNQLVLVVGDVSGKGTTAAFYMAQMKGIFQSIAQLDTSPADFLKYANQALSNCLGRNSFITLTVVKIDLHEQSLEIARAGHCPTLYYSADQKQASFFKGPGLGLGILREESFENFVKPQKTVFNYGDIILLYTDGIIEALNPQGEEYGYDNLKSLLEKNAQKSVQEISQLLVEDIHDFGQGQAPHDDYTALCLKFKDPDYQLPKPSDFPLELQKVKSEKV